MNTSLILTSMNEKPSRIATVILLAIITLSHFTGHVYAQQGGEEYRAGVPAKFPPHYSIDEKTGAPTGFAIDVMDEIAHQCGIKVKYVVYPTWEKTIQALEKGEVSLIPNLGVIAEREASMDFTSSIETHALVIFVRESTFDIKGVEDLHGKTVAVVELNKGLFLMQEQGGSELLIYATQEEAFFSLISGKADALVYPEPPMAALARKAGLEDRIKMVGKPLFEIKRSIAVREGNPALLRKLDAAVNAFIKAPQYEEIYAKWYGKPTPYWTAQRVAVFGGGLLAFAIVILVVWRYLSLLRLNRALQVAIEERKRAEEALQKSRSLLTEAESIGMVGGWEYNIDTGKQQWTDETYKIHEVDLSYAPTVEKGLRFYTPASLPIIKRAVQRAIEHGEPFDVELEIITAKGNLRSVHVRGRADLKFRRVYGFFQDTTERKRGELELLRERDKAQKYLDIAGVMFAVLDRDGRVALMNPKGCEILGYDEKDIIGVDWFDKLLPVRIHDEVKGVFLQLMSGDVKLVEYYENPIIRKDGDERTIAFHSTIIRDDTGAINGILFSGEDITERKQGEETILQQSKNLASLLEISQAITAVLDMATVLQTITESATRLAGLDTGAIYLIKGDALYLGATTPPLPPQLPEVFRRTPLADHPHIVRCISSGLSVTLPNMAIAELTPAERTVCEMRNLRSVLYVPLMIEKQAKGVLIVGTQKRIHEFTETELNLYHTLSNQAVLAVENAYLFEEIKKYASDLDQLVIERTVDLEKKSADLQDSQKALTNIVEDLHQKTDELERANVRLREIDRLKSLFIASMSHELRTPLNSIIGFSSILLNEWVGALNKEQKENVATVLKSGEHLLALINDVIDVSQIEAGTIDVHAEDFDLHDVISEAAGLFEKDMTAKGLEFIVENLHQPMHTDRRRLLQCVINLVSNGMKFTERGSVRVQARLSAERGMRNAELTKGKSSEPRTLNTELDDGRDYIEIIVEDTGIGINRDDLPKLFNSFVRLDSPLRSTVFGTGLGLYIMKKIATEVLRGEVFVMSEANKGSRFAILIPVRT